MATVVELATAEEFLKLPNNGRVQELVRGKVIEMPPPGFRHGKVCRRISRLLGDYVEDHDLGHVLVNDSGIVTERQPDTVRGADIAIYLYERLPKHVEILGYPNAAPNVIEVLSHDDRWPRVNTRVGEYLNAGVILVCIADPDAQAVTVFRADQPPQTFGASDMLLLPEILGDYKVEVSKFFAE